MPPNKTLPNAIPLVELFTVVVPLGKPSLVHTTVSGPYARLTTTDPGTVTAQLPLSLVSLQEAPPHPGASTVTGWFVPLTIDAHPGSNTNADMATNSDFLIMVLVFMKGNTFERSYRSAWHQCAWRHCHNWDKRLLCSVQEQDCASDAPATLILGITGRMTYQIRHSFRVRWPASSRRRQERIPYLIRN